MSDPASIDAAVEQLDGPFDALGNIAGVAGAMGAELVLRVNVYGLRHLTEHLLAKGADRAGWSIVNVASLAAMAWQRHLDRIAALDAAPDFAAGIDVAQGYEAGGAAAYVLSKEWVVSYTQHLAGRLLRPADPRQQREPGAGDHATVPVLRERRRTRADGVDERTGRAGGRSRRRGGGDRLARRR